MLSFGPRKCRRPPPEGSAAKPAGLLPSRHHRRPLRLRHHSALDAPETSASSTPAGNGGTDVPQLIAGNWKMHCLTAEAIALAEAIKAGAAGITAELLVCPTALHVAAVAKTLSGSPIAVGGQDCHE